MVHILIQCQVDDNTVNALREFGLDDERTFVKLLDLLEDLKEKVPPSNFDALVAAATWMKENPNVPSESYKSEFTDEVLASQLELLHEKREVEEREQELKNAKQWSHILSICGLKGDGRDLLIQSEVASVKDLLSLPESIVEFKTTLGPFGRKWYSGSEMMKKARMTTKQMGNGWFEDTVTDNLFLCCRIMKKDSTSDLSTSLTPESIESERQTNLELKTYNDEKKFRYVLHLCDLKDNMNSLNACHITNFDHLLTMPDDFESFKGVLATGQFDSKVIDRLFICIRLVKQNSREDLFTTVTKGKVTEEVRQLKSNETRHQTTTTETTTKNDAVPLHKSLKDMLESNKLGNDIREPLRDAFSDFIERAHSKCDRLDMYVADLKKTFADLSNKDTAETFQAIKTTLSGFRALINSHCDVVGVVHVSRKKPTSDVPINKSPVNADKLLRILQSMNIEPEEEPRIDKVIYAMNWSETAKSIVSQKNSTNEAIILFSPGRINVLKNLYQNENIDDNNVLLSPNEGDKKIINAIKEMEESKMWISSLQTNPECEQPEFVAMVLSSLHDSISISHDDDVILSDDNLDESRNNGQKRAAATNNLPADNNGATMNEHKKQKVGLSSGGTEADCVATTSEETVQTLSTQRSPRSEETAEPSTTRRSRRSEVTAERSSTRRSRRSEETAQSSPRRRSPRRDRR